MVQGSNTAATFQQRMNWRGAFTAPTTAANFLKWACSQWWLSFLFRICTTLRGALQIPSQAVLLLWDFTHYLITMLICPAHLLSWGVCNWKWQSHATFLQDASSFFLSSCTWFAERNVLSSPQQDRKGLQSLMCWSCRYFVVSLLIDTDFKVFCLKHSGIQQDVLFF